VRNISEDQSKNIVNPTGEPTKKTVTNMRHPTHIKNNITTEVLALH
jgi:hypothetical protein